MLWSLSTKNFISSYLITQWDCSVGIYFPLKFAEGAVETAAQNTGHKLEQEWASTPQTTPESLLCVCVYTGVHVCMHACVCVHAHVQREGGCRAQLRTDHKSYQQLPNTRPWHSPVSQWGELIAIPGEKTRISALASELWNWHLRVVLSSKWQLKRKKKNYNPKGRISQPEKAAKLKKHP